MTFLLLKQKDRVPVRFLSFLNVLIFASTIFFLFKVEHDVGDKRLCFHRQNSSITKYMDAAWRIKEQQENMN